MQQKLNVGHDRLINTYVTQQGATLAVALVILLLMSLIGSAAIKTTTLEEKMAHNMQNKDVAFQAAEAALIEAETWIANITSEPSTVTVCSAQPCILTFDSTRYLDEKDANWWASNSSQTSNTLAQVASQPRYVIEFLRFVADNPTIGHGIPSGMYYYRVTARGTGLTDDAVVIIQTSVAKRF
ncbi:MAG: hypothetical protein Tsb005_19860 [Gammaproteobacteria bacterium]